MHQGMMQHCRGGRPITAAAATHSVGHRVAASPAIALLPQQRQRSRQHDADVGASGPRRQPCCDAASTSTSSWSSGGGGSSSSSISSSSSSSSLQHHRRRRGAVAAAATPSPTAPGAAAALDAAAPSTSPRGGGLVDLSTAPHVMVNSCTGRMGHAAAEALVAAGLTLVPFTLTGYSAGVAVRNIGVSGVPVELVGKERRQQVMQRVRQEHPSLIVVDYTTPNCVNDNAQFYADCGVPFVMGTTGGDPARVAAAAEAAGVHAIVSPQMGKQVVAFQALMELMAEHFPGAFEGYSLETVESHQRNKPDTSGTARAVVQSLARLGAADASEASIRKVRDRVTQLEFMRVPEDALDGHAFHTYRLTSPDGSVGFVFKHNVTGRSVYAEGTVDAVLFLAARVAERAPQKVYSMVDVLRAGALR